MFYNFQDMRALIIFAISVFFATSIYGKARRTIFVTENGGKVFYSGHTVSTEELLTGIKKAAPGDQVLILPGTYRKKYIIGRQVDPNNPVIISGVPGLTIFACADEPKQHGESPLKFSVAQGLVIENIQFESCWPSAIEVSDSSYLTFRANKILGGHNAFRIAEQATHSIAFLRNEWLQVTAAQKNLSDTQTEGKDAEAETNSGKAFVQAIGVQGNLIIKNNLIDDYLDALQCSSEHRHLHPTRNILVQMKDSSRPGDILLRVSCAAENLDINGNIAVFDGRKNSKQNSDSKQLPKVGPWLPLSPETDTLVLDWQLSERTAELKLSGPLQTRRTFKAMAYSDANPQGESIDCRFQSERLAISCKLPNPEFNTIGFGSTFLEENHIKLWPSNTSLVVYDDKNLPPK